MADGSKPPPRSRSVGSLPPPRTAISMIQRNQPGGAAKPKFTPKIPQPGGTPSPAPSPSPSSSSSGGQRGGGRRGREDWRGGERRERGGWRGRDGDRGWRGRGEGRGRGRGRGERWDREKEKKDVVEEEESDGGKDSLPDLMSVDSWGGDSMNTERDETSTTDASMTELEEKAYKSEKEAEKRRKELQKREKARKIAQNQCAPMTLPWQNPFEPLAPLPSPSPSPSSPPPPPSSSSSSLSSSTSSSTAPISAFGGEVPGNCLLTQKEEKDSDRLFGHSDSNRLFLVQLPTVFPMSQSPSPLLPLLLPPPLLLPLKDGVALKDLPDGQMGKILVYKSGKVKLLVNGVKYDIHPGTKCTFSQQAAVISEKDRSFTVLGDVSNTMLVVPDYRDLLKSSVSKK